MASFDRNQFKDFEVERILAKRERNGKVVNFFNLFQIRFRTNFFVMLCQAEYLLKWIGFDESYNIWVYRDQLSCDDLLHDFENELNIRKRGRCDMSCDEEATQCAKNSNQMETTTQYECFHQIYLHYFLRNSLY